MHDPRELLLSFAFVFCQVTDRGRRLYQIGVHGRISGNGGRAGASAPAATGLWPFGSDSPDMRQAAGLPPPYLGVECEKAKLQIWLDAGNRYGSHRPGQPLLFPEQKIRQPVHTGASPGYRVPSDSVDNAAHPHQSA